MSQNWIKEYAKFICQNFDDKLSYITDSPTQEKCPSRAPPEWPQSSHIDQECPVSNYLCYWRCWLAFIFTCFLDRIFTCLIRGLRRGGWRWRRRRWGRYGWCCIILWRGNVLAQYHVSVFLPPFLGLRLSKFSFAANSTECVKCKPREDMEYLIISL